MRRATRAQRRRTSDVIDVQRLDCAEAESMWLAGCRGEYASFPECWLLCVGHAGGTVDRQSSQIRRWSSWTAALLLLLQERRLRRHRCSLVRGAKIGFREHCCNAEAYNDMTRARFLKPRSSFAMATHESQWRKQ